MFCQGGPYLELHLPDNTVQNLTNLSTFCQISTYSLRYLTLPYAILIITLTVAALMALMKERKVWRSGVGMIFVPILIIDFLNGIVCIRLFEQYNFENLLRFRNGSAEVLIWIEYHLIYTNSHLKIILCVYNIYMYLRSSLLLRWNPFLSLNTQRFKFKPKHAFICFFIVLAVSLTEIAVMVEEVEKEKRSNETSKVITPFLGYLNLVQCCLMLLLGILYLFVRSDPEVTWLDKFIVGGIGLNCLSTAVTGSFMLYGDMSCVFHYKPPTGIVPTCYSPFARFVAYTDSFLFAVILFRSSKIRRCFKKAVRDIRYRISDADDAEELASRFGAQRSRSEISVRSTS